MQGELISNWIYNFWFMLPDLAIAVFLAFCLSIFFGMNLYNLKEPNISKREAKFKAEIERPSGLVFVLAALGTGIFFLETTAYIILVFTGLNARICNSFFQLQFQFPFDSMVQLAGIFVTAFGYALFIWSVLARGRYATSWEMPEDQELVTWGPYGYVRHPSYLAYFFLFTGLFLTFLNLIAIIPFIAIPGYLRITDKEEEMLTKWFGKAYLEYQRTTGKFFPKRKRCT